MADTAADCEEHHAALGGLTFGVFTLDFGMIAERGLERPTVKKFG